MVGVPGGRSSRGPFRRRPEADAGGGDIGIHGSLTLARDLLAAGLVDDLRMVLAPSLAGSGVRLFGNGGELQRFLLEGEERSGGCLLLHYRRD
ncbi:dihydrofolate reductase family protein [Leifsonia sp. C5G2]|uniref:dihydrofolate reductase family protein n=1 Tax=Leifsonia sp. C5G2 TaxID=2735269 RepID=UPI001C3036E0